MINLKKLAMISAMGMVLSTGAMAAAVDGSKEASLTVEKAAIAFDDAGSSITTNPNSQTLNRGTALDENFFAISIKFTGEQNEDIGSITLPLSLDLASQEGGSTKTITIDFDQDEKPGKFTNDADKKAVYEVSSKSGLSIPTDADFAEYKADYTVSIDY